MGCKIVIPSMGRARNILTTDAITNCIIYVPNSEVDEYKEYNPDAEIVGHSDNLIGLPLKRQEICEKFGDVLMIDDDMTEMRKLYVHKGEKSKISKEDAYILIQSTYEASKQMGVYLWGFNNAVNPLHYQEQEIIKTSGFIIGGAVGINKGSKYLSYTGEIVGVDDFYISCINAYFHRTIFKDLRYTFIPKDTFVNDNGQAQFRNMETEKEDSLYLRRKFGECIKLKKGIDTGPGKRKLKNPYARTLNLPF